MMDDVLYYPNKSRVHFVELLRTTDPLTSLTAESTRKYQRELNDI